jgi:single-stranded-DNA-specific exonuclease
MSSGTMWRFFEPDRAAVRRLAEESGLSPLVAQLLVQRGIGSAAAAQAFLQPRTQHLCDPFCLRGMQEAVERIQEARRRGEAVQVFGDYDVDGISATAIMVLALRRHGIERVSWGMPRRLTEGYGLRAEHVVAARGAGVSLIITVDNGISAHAAAARARALGIDLIVTDHHSIEQGLPDALAVVTPKREAPDHPCAQLSGAGVAFKVGAALNGRPYELDLAALGTVADVMPLLGENRVIVSLGLRHMARHQRVGLACLAEVARIKLETITAEQIAFQLAPRINAAGRLDDPLLALELLLAEHAEEAWEKACMLDAANDERRALERAMFQEAVEELDAFLRPEQRAIVVGRRGWHPGVVGIVAARLQARYQRPVVMIAFGEDGVGRGSARAGNGVNLAGAFGVCAAHLSRFGGHSAAAGLTIEEGRLAAFREQFEAEIARQLEMPAAEAGLQIDALAGLTQLDGGLVRTLEQMEPFGAANPAPVLATLGVELPGEQVRIVKDEHVKFTVSQEGRVFPAIAFGMAERHHREGWSGRVDVAYTPQLNSWRGETEVQLLVRDVRPAGG